MPDFNDVEHARRYLFACGKILSDAVADTERIVYLEHPGCVTVIVRTDDHDYTWTFGQVQLRKGDPEASEPGISDGDRVSDEM